MSELKNIALIGGSGNLGKYILRALLDEPSFTVTVISRSGSSATFPSDVKVLHVPDGYPDDAMLEAFRGQDAVVFAVGHAAAARQIPLIDIAVKAGVKRFIPTEFGSNSRNKGAIEVFPVLGGKAKTNEYLRGKEAEGLSWTAVATGPFYDFCLTTGFLGFNLKDHKATIYDSGDVAFSSTTRQTVGVAVARVLKNASATANKFLYISSFQPTPNAIKGVLEKITSETFAVENVTSDDMIKLGREQMAQGNMMGGMGKLLLSSTFKGGLGADFEKEESLANDILGLAQEDLEAVTKRVLEQGD